MLNFSSKPPATESGIPFWSFVPAALLSLMGNKSKPVFMISDIHLPEMMWKVLRPSISSPYGSNILARAWTAYTCAESVPEIDKKQLTQQIFHFIPSWATLSSIYVQSFTESATPFGSFVILNLGRIRTFTRFGLTWNIILDPLLGFLNNHPELYEVNFANDWSALHSEDLPPFPSSILPALSHLSAGPRVIARLLEAGKFPRLLHVCIDAGDAPIDIGSPSYFSEALSAVAAHPSVHDLKINLRNIVVPWNNLEATGGNAKQPLVHHVHKLFLSSWPHQADHSGFLTWLAMFPALQTLTIYGRPSGFYVLLSEELVSHSLVEAIKESHPNTVLNILHERSFWEI
ncbi:hypothetical protein B0H11DRAFT_1930338 [Mycena galericulata]|nr:hypothetical protein B0H11DRAFT_1930338 [Mycena galericulata]